MQVFLMNQTGRVAVPILLWFMGVPGFLAILLWFFFFQGVPMKDEFC